MPAPAPVTAGDLLTLDELRQLRRVSGLRGAGLVLHAWTVIAGAMAGYLLWPTPLTLAIAVIVIGSRQLGLAVLMHEAAHWLLLPAPRLNDRVARWLCAAPVWSDLPGYRRRHHRHHRDTLTPADPDLARSARFPLSPGAFGRALLADLGGLTALARVRGTRPGRALAAPLVANAALFAVLAAAGGWRAYALLWLLPLATWYQLVTCVRDAAEHAVVADPDDPLRNARTTRAGALARALLAPYWVNHHLEHHLLVFVPCWKLSRAHDLLRTKGYADRMEVAPGYRAVIRRLTSPPPARAVAARGD